MRDISSLFLFFTNTLCFSLLSAFQPLSSPSIYLPCAQRQYLHHQKNNKKERQYKRQQRDFLGQCHATIKNDVFRTKEKTSTAQMSDENSGRQRRESSRLTKAKILLEQFSESKTNNDERSVDSVKRRDDRSPLGRNLVNGVTKFSNANSKEAAGGGGSYEKKKYIKAKQESTQTTTKDNTATPDAVDFVVPDNFWSNGHLVEDSNYVTRWARGVKVAEPLVKYDAVVAEKVLFRQPAKWVVRNAQIALPIGNWAVGVAFDYVADMLSTDSALSSNKKFRRRQRAKQLLEAISGLGPAIIKGGQALASRPDLLPSEYLEELQKLQDDVPRFSNSVAFETVEKELNITFDKVFELIQEEPVAAASIGQVYKARLRSNGDIIALKIQRPNCEEVIALDLYILRWWSGIYKKIFALLNRNIDLQSVIDDFGVLIYREIDYVAEAANAQRFNELYAGVTDVFVPKIYSDLTTSKVLTMEWVDGFRLTDRANLQKYDLSESKLVDILVQCSLKQILENGFFHADPHAGNLLATRDGRLCYLDFGMMSFASSNQRNGFLLAVVHIVNRDWSELVKLYQKLGFIPDNTDLKPIEIALEEGLPDVLNSDISELNFKNVVNELGDIMYTYPFSLPPFYVGIIRCLGVLEGLAIQVDPKARIIKEAYPYVASRVLTDPQDDLQEAFKRLVLTNDGKSIRWERLESLLDEASDASGYEPALALEIVSDYLISDDGSDVLDELTKQLVETTDNLGAETIQYILAASRALLISDEIAAVKAFRSIQEILQRQEMVGIAESARKQFNKDIIEVLPDPTPSMERFLRIYFLLSASSSGSSTNSDGGGDVAKFVPLIRKLAQEPRIRKALNEIIARLGERLLSRGLRAAFGLPPPDFGSITESSKGATTDTDDSKSDSLSAVSTVTEDMNY